MMAMTLQARFVFLLIGEIIPVPEESFYLR